MTMKSIFTISVFFAVFVGDVFAQWSYSEVGQWPGTCRIGKKQSPIELWRKDAKKIPIPLLLFKNYKTTFSAIVENNGHTVEVKLIAKENSQPKLLISGNLEQYILDNIHFHWDSEHTINGKRYALEAHIVHYKKDYGNVTTASGYPDGIVVLGVLFEETKGDNPKLRKIIDATKIVAHSVDSTTPIKGVAVDDFLPNIKQSFYKYQGSLTTPGCNEAVTWIVFDQTLDIGRSQLDELAKIVTSTGEPLKKNFRPLQALNGREVWHT